RARKEGAAVGPGGGKARGAGREGRDRPPLRRLDDHPPPQRRGAGARRGDRVPLQRAPGHPRAEGGAELTMKRYKIDDFATNVLEAAVAAIDAVKDDVTKTIHGVVIWRDTPQTFIPSKVLLYLKEG